MTARNTESGLGTTCEACGADVIEFNDGTIAEPRPEGEYADGMTDLVNFAFQPHECGGGSSA